MRCLLPCGVAVAALASAASADVVLNFTNFVSHGFNFTQIAAPGSLVGSLTGVSVNAELLSSTAFTYADDLSVSYVVDLFGKLKRTRQAAWASLLAELA